MIAPLIQGILDTQSNFILAAAGVCLLTAFTLILLMRNADMATQQQRVYGAFWVAVVAGVGVWTTHFVAMIGFRPDAMLTYDLRTTAISIFVGIAFVGLPMAASMFFSERPMRLGLGVAAGLGVTAMHLTGMSALENCLTTYNPLVLGLGILGAVGGFTWTMAQEGSETASTLKRVAGFTGGVCTLHFVAMASLTLSPFEGTATGIGGSFLSIMVAVVSLGVLAFAVVATFNYRRTLAMLRVSA